MQILLEQDVVKSLDEFKNSCNLDALADPGKGKGKGSGFI